MTTTPLTMAEYEEAVANGDTMAEYVAMRFHQAYEELAPLHGYETRRASAVPWVDVPEQNRDLMVDVVRRLLAEGVIRG